MGEVDKLSQTQHPHMQTHTYIQIHEHGHKDTQRVFIQRSK